MLNFIVKARHLSEMLLLWRMRATLRVHWQRLRPAREVVSILRIHFAKERFRACFWNHFQASKPLSSTLKQTRTSHSRRTFAENWCMCFVWNCYRHCNSMSRNFFTFAETRLLQCKKNNHTRHGSRAKYVLTDQEKSAIFPMLLCVRLPALCNATWSMPDLSCAYFEKLYYHSTSCLRKLASLPPTFEPFQVFHVLTKRSGGLAVTNLPEASRSFNPALCTTRSLENCYSNVTF